MRYDIFQTSVAARGSRSARLITVPKPALALPVGDGLCVSVLRQFHSNCGPRITTIRAFVCTNMDLGRQSPQYGRHLAVSDVTGHHGLWNG